VSQEVRCSRPLRNLLRFPPVPALRSDWVRGPNCEGLGVSVICGETLTEAEN